MGRPRKDNPESSAQPAGGQDAGGEGTRPAAADDSPAPAGAEPVLSEEVAPVNEAAPVNKEKAGADAADGTGGDSSAPDASAAPGSEQHDSGERDSGQQQPGDSGYDETSGIVYEVQPRGLEIFGLKDREGGEHEDPAAPGPGTPDEPPTAVRTATGDPPPPDGSGPGEGEPGEGGPKKPASGAATAVISQPSRGDGKSQDNPFRKILGRLSGAVPGDGGPPLTRFRNLPMDQKRRIWQIRAIIVVAVGLVFSLISGSWQIGLTLAIIAGIADTIYRARSVEAHAWAQPGTVDRATMRAQKRTIRQLAAMERAGYLSLHKRPIPDSEEVIDHLVVGPTGVYAIDSEKWNRGLPIRQSNGKKLWVGPENKNKRLDHACWEAGQASERLSAKLGTEITVQPALAIYGPKISWVVLDVRGVDVFAGPELKKYLRRRARRKGLPHLANDEIKKIYEAAGGVLPLEWQKSSTPVG